jgi:CRISPR/Cas system-associated endoribonuclease Cas2
MKNEKKNELTGTIIRGILISGGIAIAATNPLFGTMILPKILKHAKYKLKNKKEQKKFYDTFSYLKKKGMIHMEYRGKQIHISLTEEGKKKAGKFQIDDLEIRRSKKWNKKWHILIFDIDDKQKVKREALRGKIKELGLFQLQKSVWICPYEFFKEADILRNFFGLNADEMQIITGSSIENDKKAKLFFNLKA